MVATPEVVPHHGMERRLRCRLVTERDPEHPSLTPNADEVEEELRRMTDGGQVWRGGLDPELREPSPDPAALAWAELRRAWQHLKDETRAAYRRGRERGR
jgi:hypothetical protein